MGFIDDFLTNAKGIDNDAPITALDHRVSRELKRIEAAGDMVLSADLTAIDEVQEQAIFVATVSGGSFTLEFTLQNAETFTTAGIAWNANAATIEGAIDTAATSAAITSWTNGDITVACVADLVTTVATYTFDGASVTEMNHALIIVDGSSLTGGGSEGVVTTTTEGSADRPGYELLIGKGILQGTVPAWGVVPTALTQGMTADARLLSAESIIAICTEIAGVEGNALILPALLTAAGL